jgi:uncharacterized protein YecE (DUF72 family)
MIKVGCCGWGFYRGGLKAYSKEFKLVEVQQTFYKLPMPKTAEKWRKEVPENFEFTCKAFQAITHPPTSPTWKRSGIKVTAESKDKYGFLKPTEENFQAWKNTKEICEALKAKVCVIQCPPTFNYSPENVRNLRKFFSEIDRGKLLLAWEPRGDWVDHLEEVKKLCKELDLIHVVDLMRREPVSDQPVSYIRLHGLNPREYDYNYRYTEAELRELAKRLTKLEKDHETVYCMFNNYAMYENAKQLMAILGTS